MSAPPHAALIRTAATLLDGAFERDNSVCLAIAGTIATAIAHGLPRTQWLRGLQAADGPGLMETLFPGAAPDLAPISPSQVDDEELQAEFDDLLRLLLEAAEPADEVRRYLACAIASASLFDNHLWQDLQLPNRTVLSQLLNQHFPNLARRNTGNMRWKAFFYKQLCERAGQVCRAPSCGACDDYALCFGSEEGG